MFEATKAHTAVRRFPFGFAVAFLAAALLAGCGGSGKPTGFLDHSLLERKIRAQTESLLESGSPRTIASLKAAGANPDLDRVKSVICIVDANTKRQFTCRVALQPSGYIESMQILVSPDGQSYVGAR